MQMRGLQQSGQNNALLARMISDLMKVHKAFIDKLEEVNYAIEKKKGDKGDKGDRGPIASRADVLRFFREEVAPLIPEIPTVIHGETPSDEKIAGIMMDLLPSIADDIMPKKGVDYLTDAEKIEFIEAVANLVRQEPLEIDDEMIVGALEKGKMGKKFKIDDIAGLRQFLNEIDHTAKNAYLHGGGDTVAPGTNITLGKDSQGRVVINSTGGSGSGSNNVTEKLVPTQAGSNVTLNLAQLSNPYTSIGFIGYDGQILDPSSSTRGWSKSGDTITILNAVASSDDYYQVNYNYGSVSPGGTTAFGEPVSFMSFTGTLAHTPTAGTVRLFRGGARQRQGVDYTISGATITLTLAASPGEEFLADYAY